MTALTKGGSLIDVTPRRENQGVRPGNTIFLLGLRPLGFLLL